MGSCAPFLVVGASPNQSCKLNWGSSLVSNTCLEVRPQPLNSNIKSLEIKWIWTYVTKKNPFMNENVRGQFVQVLFNGLIYILLLVYSKISFNNFGHGLHGTWVSLYFSRIRYLTFCAQSDQAHDLIVWRTPPSNSSNYTMWKSNFNHFWSKIICPNQPV